MYIPYIIFIWKFPKFNNKCLYTRAVSVLRKRCVMFHVGEISVDNWRMFRCENEWQLETVTYLLRPIKRYGYMNETETGMSSVFLGRDFRRLSCVDFWFICVDVMLCYVMFKHTKSREHRDFGKERINNKE